MVVCTVTKEGVIDNKGYRDYWHWQEEFERKRNARYVEPAPQSPPAPAKAKPRKQRKYENRWQRYEAGWTDSQSAKAEGVETKVIGQWRRAHGLDVNKAK